MLATAIALLANAALPAQDAVDASTFKDHLLTSPGTLVDVRAPEEWKEGVIAGALLLDFHDDGFAKRIAAVDREQPAYIYCAVGGRSHLAAVQLRKLGHQHVVELDGGIEAWLGAGYPVVPPGSTGKR